MSARDKGYLLTIEHFKYIMELKYAFEQSDYDKEYLNELKPLDYMDYYDEFLEGVEEAFQEVLMKDYDR